MLLVVTLNASHAQFWKRSGNKVKSGGDTEQTFPLETIYTDIKGRPVMKLLSHLQFSGSVGAGLNQVTQDLISLGLFQATSKEAVLFSPSTGTPATGVTNWSVSPKTTPLTITSAAGDVLFNTETQQLRYRGQGMTLPMNLMVSTRIKRFRAGIGFGVQYFAVSELRSVEFPDRLRSVSFSDKTLSYKSLHGYFGYDFHRIQDWIFTADVQAGKTTLGRAFELKNVRSPMILGAGVTIRKEITEYFSVFMRPAVTSTSYTYAPVGTVGSISQRANSLSVSVGVTIGVPELPKCFVKTCGIQMNHPHGNKEYRSRVHPIYKRQNPGYGENYGPRVKPVGTKAKK